MTRCVFAVLLCLCLLQPPLSVGGEKPTTEPQTAEEAMNHKLPKALVKGDFKQAVETVAKLANVKIEVDWTAVEATGVKQDQKITMRASKITPGELLDLILVQAAAEDSPLAWYIDGDTVRVTTQMLVLHRNSLPARAIEESKEKQPKAQPLKFEFTEIPISEVIENFRKISGVNFYVNWKSLEEVGVEKNTPVTLDVTDVSIGQALDLVLDGLSGGTDKYNHIYWVLNENVIHIATGKTLDTKKVTRVYDIADLLMIIPDNEGPNISKEIINGNKGDDNKSDSFFEEDEDKDGDGRKRAETRKEKEEALIKIIKESIGEDMWQPDGKGSISIVQKKLYITQTMLGWKLLEQSLGK